MSTSLPSLVTSRTPPVPYQPLSASSQLQPVITRKTAQDHGFQQLMFSELGPDVAESLQLLCEEIVPAL